MINLLQHLRRRARAHHLFIAHDLGIVETSHRVAVMYLGRIMEIARRRSSTGIRATRIRRRC